MKIALPESAAGAAALLGGALVAAGAWLLFPRERDGGAASRPPVRVCLIDVSASAVSRRTDWRNFVEGEIDAQRSIAGNAGEDLEIVLFGSEVRRIAGRLSNAGERETRLAGAVEVARGLALDPTRRGARVVVIGDRTYTGEDPAPGIRELLAVGVPFEWVDLPPPDREEFSFGPLLLPPELEVGAPIALEADAFYAPGPERRGTLTTTLVHESAAGREERRVEIAVPPGLGADPDGYVRWRVRETAGVAAGGLNRVRLLGGRGFSRSDVDGEDAGEGVVRCEGRLVLADVSIGQPLVAGQRPQDAFELHGEDGLDLETIWPSELGLRLPALDAIVTRTADVLPVPVLRSFVERGGGWLRVGSASLGSGSVEEVDLQPLRPADEDRDPRDIVVLVDRSGSMAGETFESVRRAVLRLVEAAPAKDAVELVFFGEQLSDPVVLKSSQDLRERDRIVRDAAERFFGVGGPGGSTAIARSLESFAEARERAQREALVFLLSDGKDTVDRDAAPRCARVLPRLLAARARLVVIAAGSDPDMRLLEPLVAPGETLRAVGELASSSRSLAEIFEREISKDRIREGESLRVLPAAVAEGSLAADILRAGMPSDPASWPTLRKYARAKLAPGAEAIWVSDRGEPLLAIQRVGRGVVAASAFDADPAWSQLLAPLLRTLARGKKEFGARARFEEGVLTVEGLPEGSPAQLEARVFTAEDGRPPVVLALSPPIEGAEPSRTRTAPARAQDLAGAERIEVRAPGAIDEAWPPLELLLASPRSPEFVLPRPRVDPEALRAPALRAPERSATGPRPHPAAAWVLFSGLCLLTLSGLAGFFSRRGSGRAGARDPGEVGRQAIPVRDRRDTP